MRAHIHGRDRSAELELWTNQLSKNTCLGNEINIHSRDTKIKVIKTANTDVQFCTSSPLGLWVSVVNGFVFPGIHSMNPTLGPAFVDVIQTRPKYKWATKSYSMSRMTYSDSLRVPCSRGHPRESRSYYILIPPNIFNLK